MIMQMYAIKDELNGYTTPIPMISEEVAKRYLKDEVMGNPTVRNSPKDFSIWRVGTWDSETATFIGEPDGLKLIERAENYGN